MATEKVLSLVTYKNTRMRITKGMFDITCFGKLYSRIFCTILFFCMSLYDNPYLKSLDHSHSFFYVLFCILNANSIETLNHRVTHPIWPTMGFPGQESQNCISALFTENPPEEIFWRVCNMFHKRIWRNHSKPLADMKWWHVESTLHPPARF